MAMDTSRTSIAVATKVLMVVEAKNTTKAVLTTAVVARAAGSRCIMQKMQPITVMAM